MKLLIDTIEKTKNTAKKQKTYVTRCGNFLRSVKFLENNFEKSLIIKKD